MTLWDQTRPKRQLETAQQPCARVQKCHCSQLELTGRAPKPAQRQDGAMTGQRMGTRPRQECQARFQEEADR